MVRLHKFAISGSTSSERIQERIKRKRSLDEKTENKRDKPDIDLSNSESYEEDMAKEKLGIKAEIRSAIADDDFLEMLSKAFAKKLTEDLKIEINEVREKGDKTEKRVDDLEIKVDEYEQDKRVKNVIISGIPSGQAKKEGIRQLLNTKLKCNVGHES
jgi:predicted  nucleic acid-binding Zn-ribbon protein